MEIPMEVKNKPHAVLVPFPAQGHINPMLKLAKTLHNNGYHITFVYTKSVFKRVLSARGLGSMNGLASFKFETIPDGIPPKDPDADASMSMPNDTYCLGPFLELITKLNDTDVPPVSFIIADAVMGFTIDAAQELGIPEFLLWVYSATASLVCTQHVALVEKGYIPLKDGSQMTNGYLDTVIEEIPYLEGFRLKDLPRINIVNTDPKDIILEFAIPQTNRIHLASGFLVNTFDDLEYDAMKSLRSIHPKSYAIGPLNLLDEEACNNKDLEKLGSNLWAEDDKCLEWLDTKDSKSVIYVNFGSTALITSADIIEIAWGLANSNQSFLLIIGADLVIGETAIIPPQLLESTKERGMVTSWCPQEKVLAHRSVVGFLTHTGWNSVLESISNGVPMICWPSFADQFTNCWKCCTEWGIGMEMKDVTRDVVEKLVRELAVGDKGKEMKKKIVELKNLAHHSVKHSSRLNLEKAIDEVVLTSLS